MRGQANGVEDRRPRGDDHEADDDEDEEEEEEEGRHRGQGPPQQRRNQAQRPSSGPQQQQQQQPRPQPPLTRNVGYVGKHRLSAAIARLDQELQSLQVTAQLAPLPALLSQLCSINSNRGRPWPARTTPSSSVRIVNLLPELCAIQILPAA